MASRSFNSGTRETQIKNHATLAENTAFPLANERRYFCFDQCDIKKSLSDANSLVK